ncbi:deoxyribonuclease [Campylobacter jejuni]|nr:deoxyribonuclease [Campylobacter jejuni]
MIKSDLYTPRNEYTKKGKINQRAKRIEWEHIMPAQNFGKHLPCWKEGGRKACQNDPLFTKMEADKQNLVPAIGEINGDRSNFRYAEAPTNLKYTQYGNCKVYTDFKAKRFYPANYSKGWIARSYLYMSKTYNIRLSDQERKLMEAWDKQYPIDEKEKRIRELL